MWSVARRHGVYEFDSACSELAHRLGAHLSLHRWAAWVAQGKRMHSPKRTRSVEERCEDANGHEKMSKFVDAVPTPWGSGSGSVTDGVIRVSGSSFPVEGMEGWGYVTRSNICSAHVTLLRTLSVPVLTLIHHQSLCVGSLFSGFLASRVPALYSSISAGMYTSSFAGSLPFSPSLPAPSHPVRHSRTLPAFHARMPQESS